MGGNAVAELAPLAQLAELDTLAADDNLVTSLAPLAVRFHGYANLNGTRVSDFAPLLSFKSPWFTAVLVQYQRDENGEPLVDCAEQADTLALAKGMNFAGLLTDCP